MSNFIIFYFFRIVLFLSFFPFCSINRTKFLHGAPIPVLGGFFSGPPGASGGEIG
jgi:hypothetical protein